jgi:AcrR family transcriptional regulator
MADQTNSYHHGDLRAALLDETARMIAENGTESVTMRAIGLRLGVSRAAPYRHFADKNALLVAVAAAGFDRLKKILQVIDSGAPRSTIEQFRNMGDAYVRFALENPAHYRLMYGKEALTRSEEPELQDAAMGLFDQLVLVIQANQRSGGIKKQNPRNQAYVAWSAVHGLASLIIEGQIQAADDVDLLIKQTTTTVLDGMRTRRSK